MLKWGRISGLIDGVRGQKRLDGEEKRFTRPLENSARTTTSQLFALCLVECLRDGLATRGSSEAPFRQALNRRAGFQVGVTGLSIDSYMRMGQELIDSMESKFRLDQPFVFRSVETIASFRFEAIQSAMKDSYHWQRILRPSALLDFDTLVLGSLALSSGFGLGPFDRLLSDDVPYLGAPRVAAKLLQQGPEQEPLSTY